MVVEIPRRAPSRRSQRLAEADIGCWQPPLQRCRRYELPEGNLFRLKRINKRLAELGEFEACFDWTTTASRNSPGCHVYQVRKGGCRSDDILFLVIKGQWNPNRPWSRDDARPPGTWMIKALDDKLNAPPPEDIKISNDRRKLAVAKKDWEAERHFRKEIGTYTTAGKNRNSLGTRIARKNRRVG